MSNSLSANVYEQPTIVDSLKFTYVVSKLRHFFGKRRGFVEIFAQNRLSILAACEDPGTLCKFNYLGEEWPLPQTSQMWLEWELLNRVNLPEDVRPKGYFSLATSFRDEPNPIAGRHDKIFPMFEYEMEGDVDNMIEMLCELLEFLGFGDRSEYNIEEYDSLAKKYGVKELECEHERKMFEDNHVTFITRFPEFTDPFWNMQRCEDGVHAKKVDVIIYDETIGAAERSCDVEEMRRTFRTICNGEYAKTVFDKFGEERVMQEMDLFLALPFVKRSGGGIGLTRLMRIMERLDLVPSTEAELMAAIKGLDGEFAAYDAKKRAEAEIVEATEVQCECDPCECTPDDTCGCL